jgi:hypothetical protein
MKSRRFDRRARAVCSANGRLFSAADFGNRRSGEKIGKILIIFNSTMRRSMQKIKVYLILLGFTVLFSSSSLAQTSKPKKIKSEKSIKLRSVDSRGCRLASYSKIGNKIVTAHYNCDANVKTFTLSQTEIYAECLNKEKVCLNFTQKIDVLVEAIDSENDVMTYNYVVKTGKIIGQGRKVVWDLSGVKPGTYTIRAWVDDGCGDCGKSITKEIKIVECPNCN